MNRGQIARLPTPSTLIIILVSEKINEMLQNLDNVNYSSLAKTIFNNINFIESLYELAQFELHQPDITIQNSQITHKEEFLSEVLRTFLTMKSKQICKRISFEKQSIVTVILICICLQMASQYYCCTRCEMPILKKKNLINAERFLWVSKQHLENCICPMT